MDVVAHAGCSRRTLERRFLSVMKMPVHDFLNGRRIDFAKRSIQSDLNEKLDTIAAKCGFGDSKTFRKAFIASTGLPPSDWRRQLLEK